MVRFSDAKDVLEKLCGNRDSATSRLTRSLAQYDRNLWSRVRRGVAYREEIKAYNARRGQYDGMQRRTLLDEDIDHLAGLTIQDLIR
jgi:hypothetical protein